MAENLLPSEGLTTGERDIDGDARARMRGVNVGSDGTKYPRVSKADYGVLVGSVAEQNDDVLMLMLSRVCAPESDAWKDFLSVRAGFRNERPDGQGSYVVQKIATPRYVAPWETRLVNKSKDDLKLKKYTLSQTLSDSYVREKYAIPQKLVASVSTLALTQPADAAATMQEFLRLSSEGKDVNIRVVAGAYAGGIRAAITDIQRMAAQAPQLQIGTPGTIVGDWLFLDAGEGDDKWQVKGPIQFASSVRDIMRLAVSAGQHETIHCFAVETARLRIDVINSVGVVAPDVIGHACAEGDLRFMEDSGTEGSLSTLAKSRWDDLKMNVLPLCTDGVHNATALKLSDKVLIANRHVVDDAGKVEVRGKQLGLRQVVGDDLWAFRYASPCSQWNFREPVSGEKACILYHNGTKSALSATFTIVKTDGMLLLSTLTGGVVPGMSGGAVVAMSDFSLLGVHGGETMRNLRATRITETVYHDMCDFVSESSNEVGIVDGADGEVRELLKARGLGQTVSRVVTSLLPVYEDGEHTGTVLQTIDGLLSAVSGDLNVAEDVVITFERHGVIARASEYIAPEVAEGRNPLMGEAVACIGVDKDGPVITGELKILNVGPKGVNFLVSSPVEFDFPMGGAVVVSLHDGSVLGIVVRNTKAGLFGVVVPRSEGAPIDYTVELGKVFPTATVQSWDAVVVQQAFNLSSGVETVEDWAQLGAMALQLKAAQLLQEARFPRDRRSHEVERITDVAMLVKVYQNLNLSRLVDTDGAELTDVQAANVLLALIHVADLYEKPDVVKLWLQSLGLLPDYDYVSRGCVRRPSGFNVVANDGRTLSPYGD